MEVSKSFLELCYATLVQKGRAEYRGYTLKWIKQSREFQFNKKNRRLASWFLENDVIENYGKEKNPAEYRMTKQFQLLPQKLEDLYQLRRNQEAEIRKEKERQDTVLEEEKKRQEQKILLRFMNDLNERCSQLKNREISDESIESIINDLAYKYIDEWFVVGIHPDRYEDNFPMYYSFARSRVRSALCNVEDKRIQKYIRKNSKISQPAPSLQSIIAKMTDEEIENCTQIIPVRAQREGNLVTITELDDKRFEKLTDGAIQYAVGYVKQHIRDYVPNSQIEVCWWEGVGEYFLPSANSDQQQKEPLSFREYILGPIKALERPASKSKAKPSRVQLEVQFITEDKEIEIWKYRPQRGVITWSRKS